MITMKKLTFRYLAFLAAVLCLGSCNDEQSEALVQVKMNVALDFSEAPLPTVTRAEQETFRRRFIVDAYGKEDTAQPAARKIIILDLDEAGESGTSFRLPVEMHLPPREYSLVVWSDFVEMATGTDYFYNTATLAAVSCMPTYYPGHAKRPVHSGVVMLNLAEHDWSTGNVRQVEVPMQQAVAPITLKAADYETLQATVGEGALDGATLTVSYIVPFTGFNALTGEPVAASQPLVFSLPLEAPKKGVAEISLLKDYVFAGASEEPALLSMNLAVLAADGTELNKVENLSVPFKRGYATTVTGNILTSSFTGGLAIDTDFDAEDQLYDLDNNQTNN